MNLETKIKMAMTFKGITQAQLSENGWNISTKL